ncbi:hypothetical protein PCO86_05715 [Pectobacteriaceae bacterium CE70]|nr:hypothetical protein PCO86_05715 [Pectobacteriaceae bacterium CE70]WJY11866.1 hypothetical protein PCO80_05545 [Pectobacteriaceae bacterium C80]
MKLYSLLRRLPIIGSVFRIVNAYAYKGNSHCQNSIAPIKLWWSRILKKMLWVAFFVGVLLLIKFDNISNWAAADTVLSVFPSVLGFGIGAFALLFIMPSNFMLFLTQKREHLGFGPEIVPVDMGYPLIVFTFVMIIAGLNKMFPNLIFNVLSIWAFFYGLAMALELIAFLFNASVVIHKIISKDD